MVMQPWFVWIFVYISSSQHLLLFFIIYAFSILSGYVFDIAGLIWLESRINTE